MRLRLAVAADYANVSNDGKLNIMGVFHEISSAAFPTALRQGYLVLEWEASPAETGTERQLTISFVDPDGEARVGLNVSMTVPESLRPGSNALFNQIINVAGTPIDRAGGHAFYVLADNDEKGRVELYVHEVSQGGESSG